MNCPYCKKEMILGYLQGGRSIIWGAYKHNLSFHTDVRKGEMMMAQQNLNGAYKESFHCTDCNKLVVECS